MVRSTEFDGIFSVGETHTPDPPESSEVSNDGHVVDVTGDSDVEVVGVAPAVCCSIVGCYRSSRMEAIFTDGTVALVCCELCFNSDTNSHTADCDTPRTNKHKSKIGESRSSDSYSHNSGLPETDNVIDFTPEIEKENADESLYSDLYSLEPPHLFNDNKGTTQTVNNPVTNSNIKHVATKRVSHTAIHRPTTTQSLLYSHGYEHSRFLHEGSYRDSLQQVPCFPWHVRVSRLAQLKRP